MVGNKARVEGCIVEEFKYKEIAYFTSVYFTEEHNVNEPLPIPSDSCYHACNLEDEENYGIVQEDDLPSSFNIEISERLDSLVEDPNDVDEVVKKIK
jgi:hypothetical protein